MHAVKVCLGIVLATAAGLCAEESPEDAFARARARIREVTGRPYVSPSLWGGPVVPDTHKALEAFLYEVRERARPRVVAELAALDGEAFARLFEPAAMSEWQSDELELVFRAVLRRGKAPAVAIMEMQRAAADVSRPLRVRIVAACAAARLGKRSQAPFLVFAGRAASEIVTIAQWIQEAQRKSPALQGGRSPDREPLARFCARWEEALGDISETLQRVIGPDLPKLEPGDWGAVARWEAWAREGHGPLPSAAQVEDGRGRLIWYSRGAARPADGAGHVQCILMDAVRDYVTSNPSRRTADDLLADGIRAAVRLARYGAAERIVVTVGAVVKELQYDDETKSWQCMKQYRLLDENGLF